ncbi:MULTISPECIES: hypothetical protein [unclassified Ensifer]|uniref:hypothetical protein n=1 Tax=unclassified Ensifer TaxID=2633371 RepID=UPI0008136CB1|nr:MULTISPECIES: hypothetical protein [unclassified Ensifer]OCP17028.1 hypothetical protein BC360_12385 [Ensifer sp. LC163]OCP24143.1 hypothetical protein BC363_23190 [Ensifer sp. LC384]OCP25624.1 hypothetical protein BC361_17505 [Ensifer sp. LC54]
MAISPVFREKYKAQQQKRAQGIVAREKAEADAAGLTIAELRNHKDAVAKRKWQERTQAAYHRAKGEKALAKRNARIEQESTERMKENEVFGRF